MEELLTYMILLSEELVPESEYYKRLDELFLNHPENDDLLYLEWETDIKKEPPRKAASEKSHS